MQLKAMHNNTGPMRSMHSHGCMFNPIREQATLLCKLLLQHLEQLRLLLQLEAANSRWT